MRARYLVLVFVLLGADAASPKGGTITGSLTAVKDGNAVTRDDVYVYLEQVPRPKRDALPGAKLTREIVQRTDDEAKGPYFSPKVLVVPVGTTVFFPNVDKSKEHNVFSPTDPIFDLGRYSFSKKGKSRTFEIADEFDIFCDVHPTMWAKIKVVDSPYIVRVVGGKFTFTNIPPGKYKVVAWVRNSTEVRSSVITLTAGGTVTLDKELHLQVKSRSGCHDRKDGTPYNNVKYGKPCPEDY
jgi:plastocyanin